jgi:cellulose synthase/poly-beta-1,6-N-acetylglucosamine synthase-like glycosyltransferase
MFTLKLFFIISSFIIFYAYFGYAIISLILIKMLKKTPIKSNEKESSKSVTLLIAAFNEEKIIESKILNSLEIEYPKDLLSIYIVTDGSTDGTEEIVKRYPQITLFHNNDREGKVAAITRVMKFVKSEIVVFSDANTLLNKESILKIVSHYGDPKVGGVAGEKKVISLDKNKVAGEGEGLYWKYESFLKKVDSKFYSVVGAAGELFSVRTALYENPGKDAILDDFVISLTVCLKGYKIIYEPGAYASETPSASIKEEKKRKIRISAGAFQSMAMMKELLYFWKNPKLSFLYISHRVLRWTLSPLLLPCIFIVNLIICFNVNDVFYQTTMLLQILFYLVAFLGWFLPKIKINLKAAYFAYYFVFMNISLYQGFFRHLNGKQSVLWEKAKRA